MKNRGLRIVAVLLVACLLLDPTRAVALCTQNPSVGRAARTLFGQHEVFDRAALAVEPIIPRRQRVRDTSVLVSALVGSLPSRAQAAAVTVPLQDTRGLDWTPLLATALPLVLIAYLWNRALRVSDARILRPAQWRASTLGQRLQKGFAYIHHHYPEYIVLVERGVALERYLRGNTAQAPHLLEEALAGLRPAVSETMRVIFVVLRVGLIEGDLDYETLRIMRLYLFHRVAENYEAEDDDSFIQMLRGKRRLRITSSKAQALLDRVYHVYQDVGQGDFYRNELMLWDAAVESFWIQLISSLQAQKIFWFHPDDDPNRIRFRAGRQDIDIFFQNSAIFIAPHAAPSHRTTFQGRSANPLSMNAFKIDIQGISVQNAWPGNTRFQTPLGTNFPLRAFAVTRAGLYVMVSADAEKSMQRWNADRTFWPILPLSVEDRSRHAYLNLPWVDLVPDVENFLSANTVARRRGRQALDVLQHPRWFPRFPLGRRTLLGLLATAAAMTGIVVTAHASPGFARTLEHVAEWVYNSIFFLRKGLGLAIVGAFGLPGKAPSRRVEVDRSLTRFSDSLQASA